jgi:hypothetical protein
MMHSQRYGLTQLEAEIRLQNEICLEAWRKRWLARDLDCVDRWPSKFAPPMIDAYRPLFRVCLDRWFQEQREIAKRWLFKNRCLKRQALRLRPFGLHPLPLRLRTHRDRL